MKIWIYLDGRQQGPYSLEELRSLPVTEDTKVWFDGLPKWLPAGSLEELRSLFAAEENNPEVQQTEVATVEVETESTEHVHQAESAQEEAEDSLAPGRRYRRSALPSEPCPKSYLGWSIAVCVFLFSPISLGALISSICVPSKYMRGNVKGARRASSIAVWLIMISIALGFIPVMIMSSLLQ